MKTKQDLLRAMVRINACPESHRWVRGQTGNAAAIGARCDRYDWIAFFLWCRLDLAGRELLLQRCNADVYPSLRWSPWWDDLVVGHAAASPAIARELRRCWRAWCRS